MKNTVEIAKILRLSSEKAKVAKGFDEALKGLGVALQSKKATPKRA